MENRIFDLESNKEEKEIISNFNFSIMSVNGF